MAADAVSQTNTGQIGGIKENIPAPLLLQPLVNLGVKLNIRKNSFSGTQYKILQNPVEAQNYINKFASKYSGAIGKFTHREYLKVLLDLAVSWGLIEKTYAEQEKERLERYVRITPTDQLNVKLGFGKSPRLFETIVRNTQFIGGTERIAPVRTLIEKLPVDSKLRTASLGYLNFRDLSNKEQWREVKKASLVTAVKAGEAAVELKNKSLAIFDRGYEWFWNDTKFGQVIRAERDKAVAAYKRRVMGPVARANVVLDKKLVEPVREEVIKPLNVYGKAFFEDIKIQSGEHTATKKWQEMWGSLSGANETLAKDGPVKSIGDYIVSLRRKKRNGQGILQGFSLAEFAVSAAVKTIVGTIRTVVTVVKPVNQVVTAVRGFTQDRITAVKAGLSSVVRPWMVEKWNGLTSLASKTANVVRTGWRVGSNAVGALGDAAIPTALTFVLTGGNPIAAGAVGITSLGGSAAARYLNAAAVSSNYTLQREFIFKYGSFAGRERIIIENLRNFAPNIDKYLSKAEISQYVREEVMRAGGSSRVSMAAGSTKAFGLGMTIGFALGLGPLGAAGVGLAFAGGSFALSSIKNSISVSKFAQNLNAFGFFELPANQVLGTYLGGKWLEDQIRKMFTNRRYWQDEWMNMSLSGGLGNTITLVSSGASAIGVGRWALNSVNKLGETVAFKAIGGAATVARAMGTGSLIGSIIGAGIGALVFNIAPGVGAIVGGFVGGVAGGLAGAALAGATGGAATPAVFWGSLGGSALGAFLGTGLDWLFDNARRFADAFAGFLGLLSIAKFLATLASVLTAPLRKLTDYVELVVPIALGLITITMISIGTSQSASNTPVSGSGGSGSTDSGNVIASIISPFISDISAVPKKEKLDIPTSEKISVSSCYGSDNSNYYLKENGRFLGLRKNYGITLTSEQKISILNPIETTVFYNGESPLFIKSKSGEFIKSGENALILTPSSLTSSYFILLEGIISDLEPGEKVKEDYPLGNTGSNFRISVLTEAATAKYDPSKTIDPCSQNLDVNFPGFSCDIIPQFQEICADD